jgi:hypothetical protein
LVEVSHQVQAAAASMTAMKKAHERAAQDCIG